MEKLVILAAIGLCLLQFSVALGAPVQHSFGVKQYDEFHDVLHPLEHEALPKGDYARIRTQSNKLIMHGMAIVKLGVPSGTKSENVAEFKQELNKFNKGLKKLKTDTRSGTDEKLKASFSAVHDSFEMLAAMLPK